MNLLFKVLIFFLLTLSIIGNIIKLIDTTKAKIKKDDITIYVFKYGNVSILLDLWVISVTLESKIKMNERMISIKFLKLKKLKLFICLFIDNFSFSNNVKIY